MICITYRQRFIYDSNLGVNDLKECDKGEKGIFFVLMLVSWFPVLC